MGSCGRRQTGRRRRSDLTIHVNTAMKRSAGTAVQRGSHGCTTAHEAYRGPKSPSARARASSASRRGRTAEWVPCAACQGRAHGWGRTDLPVNDRLQVRGVELAGADEVAVDADRVWRGLGRGLDPVPR